ncbi:MAG: glycosyltransferase, partial [Fibrobacter sp.]|nr:glycosyltransferase [Fibrobacter sp.]
MVQRFHSSEFESIDELAGLKASGKKSISVVIPALNEEATIGPIVTYIKQHFMEKYGLVDELVVMDGMSEDQTVQRATDAGACVYNHENAGPAVPLGGKGVSLWKSQFVTSGDIVIFIDSDITDFDRRFICGLAGPLLRHENLFFIKAFYRRPL